MCEGEGVEWKVEEVGDEVGGGVWEININNIEGEDDLVKIEEELLVISQTQLDDVTGQSGAEVVRRKEYWIKKNAIVIKEVQRIK